MAQKSNQQPAEPHKQAEKEGVAIELSEDALANLTGYFDVLIKMDFAQKLRNERNSNGSRNNSENADYIKVRE